MKKVVPQYIEGFNTPIDYMKLLQLQASVKEPIQRGKQKIYTLKSTYPFMDQRKMIETKSHSKFQ